MAEACLTTSRVRRGKMCSLSAMAMSLGGAMSPRCRLTPATRIDEDSIVDQ
jgi:hypothetical protein